MPSLISQMQQGGTTTQTPMQMQQAVPQAKLQSEAVLQQLRQTAGMLRNARNPQMMMQNMLMSNPNLKQVINFIQMTGKSPEQAMAMLAQQNGLDPNDVLKALQGK